MHAAPAPVYARPHRIRFSECDPAGIVFFPQYFVMLNGLVEDWFDDALGLGYREVVAGRQIGLPSVRLEADFKAVSRFGDDVSLQLQVERLGQKSLTLLHRCVSADGGELRMGLRQTLVTTSLQTHRAIEVPADIRRAIDCFSQQGS